MPCPARCRPILALFFMVLLASCVTTSANKADTSDDPKSGKGEQLLQSNRLEEARAHFMSETKRAPSDVNAWHGLGATCYRLQDFNCALQSLERARTLSQDNAGVLASLGLLQYKMNRPEDAKRTLERAIKLDPKHGPAHNNLGLVLLSLKDLRGAKEAFTAALDARIDDLVAMENLGVLLLFHEADAKAASVYLERRLRIMQQRKLRITAEDYRVVGLAALFADNENVAISYFDEARSLAPDRAELSFHLGMSYIKAGELVTAVEHLKTAVSKEPNNPIFASMLGRLLTRLKRCEEALPVLQSATQGNPQDADAFMGLGICLQVFKKKEASDAAFKTACDLGLQDACETP